MTTLHIPMNGMFDSKIVELADRFQAAKSGHGFKLCLYENISISVDAALGFYDVVRSRPKGVRVHIHSHVCLMGADVLVWLSGDTRTLRAEGWISFMEHPVCYPEESEDGGSKKAYKPYKTPCHENYLSAERLVKKMLPPHLLNRRVWGAELEEWNIIRPSTPPGLLSEACGPAPKNVAAQHAASCGGKPTQLVLF